MRSKRVVANRIFMVPAYRLNVSPGIHSSAQLD